MAGNRNQFGDSTTALTWLLCCAVMGILAIGAWCELRPAAKVIYRDCPASVRPRGATAGTLTCRVLHNPAT